MNTSLYLASQSPRRTEILSLLGIPHQILRFDMDESTPAELAPELAPEWLARQKALFAQESLKPEHPTLCADTLVLFEGEALGKPQSYEEALWMLQRLRNQTHVVRTGIACFSPNQELQSTVEETQVKFAHYSDEDIHQYLSYHQFLDKAGAYSIQSYGARFIEQINGCFYNVMGLPVQKTLALLKEYL